MVSIYILWFFLILSLGFAVYLVVDHLTRFPRRSILDVPNFLRAADPKRMQELFNPEFEGMMRANLPRREFLQQQRKSLHYAREFLLCTAHDAQILIELAQNEVWRERVEHPGAPDGEEYIERALKLHQAAVEYRTYALVALVRVRIWMVFRTQWWLPFPAPRVGELKEISGINFHAAYNRLMQTVSDLCQLYGSEFQEALLGALTKSDTLTA
jgi:hypothetical protein